MSLNQQMRTIERRRSRRWLLVLVLVALTGGVLTAATLRPHRAETFTAESCTPTPPEQASPAAVAFLAAFAAAMPAWQRIDAKLAKQGNVAQGADLNSQSAADQAYLKALGAITFPPGARPAATALTKAIQSYVRFLQTAYAQPGYLARHPADDEKLNLARDQASDRLREALGLRPEVCSVDRP